MLEGKGDLVREVPRGVQADQHDVLVLRGKKSLIYSKINIFEKCDIYCLVQADAVPKCDTVEVEKQIEVISGFHQHDLVSPLKYSTTFSLS